MVQEAKKKTVHMEGTWRLGSTSVGLHHLKHRFRNSVKDVQTLPGADIDSDHNLTGCQSLHQVEENYKIPKEQT